jgi:hypothetical protein
MKRRLAISHITNIGAGSRFRQDRIYIGNKIVDGVKIDARADRMAVLGWPYRGDGETAIFLISFGKHVF